MTAASTLTSEILNVLGFCTVKAICPFKPKIQKSFTPLDYTKQPHILIIGATTFPFTVSLEPFTFFTNSF